MRATAETWVFGLFFGLSFIHLLSVMRFKFLKGSGKHLSTNPFCLLALCLSLFIAIFLAFLLGKKVWMCFPLAQMLVAGRHFDSTTLL